MYGGHSYGGTSIPGTISTIKTISLEGVVEGVKTDSGNLFSVKDTNKQIQTTKTGSGNLYIYSTKEVKEG